MNTNLIAKNLFFFPNNAKYSHGDSANSTSPQLLTNPTLSCHRKKYRKQTALLFILFLQCVLLQVAAQPPAISSFTPENGPIGTTVTITGSNFSAVPADNIVYFGAVQVAVTAASTNSLTVTVPTGTTYEPLTVTTNNLTAYSSKPFIVTFPTISTGFTSNSFATKTDYAIRANSYSASIEDLDGDGKPDLAVAGNNGSSFSVLRNTSTGGAISFAAKVDYITSSAYNAIAIGDLDGDGKPDLAVTNYFANTISIFRNISTTGVISFAAKVDFSTGTGPGSVCTGDMNGDGKTDLAVANGSSGTVSILKNSSTPGVISFAAKIDYPTGSFPYDITSADLDGDGKPDLAVANSSSGTVSLFRNLSSGGVISFAAKIDYVTGNSPYCVTTGDLDGDNKPDLAIANLISNTVSVLRNGSTSGVFSFAAKIDYTTGANPFSVSISDLDGNGKPDLVVSHNNSNAVSVFGNGSSSGIISFATRVDCIAGYALRDVKAGDVNGDGKPDLIVVNNNDNTVSVLKNQSDAPYIAAFTPTNGSVGTTVTITGINFTGATAVSLAGVTATSFTVVSNTEITAVVGAVGGGNISVTTPSGTGTRGGFYNGPAIEGFTPGSGPIGTTVSITGSNFNPVPAGNTVYFGAVKAIVSAATTTSLTVAVPPGASYQPITVTTGNLTAYSKTPFIVTFPANSVGFTPNTFAAKADYPFVSNSGYFSCGDLDDDGKADLVVANYTSNNISIFRNTSTTGIISFAARIDIITGTNPYHVAIGDVDGDGKPDLAVANYNSNTISVLRNTSTGGVLSFSPKVDYSTGTYRPVNIACRDLDGDGRQDLVAVNSGNNISIFKNESANGVVSFGARLDYTTGSGSFGLAITDFDGDGKVDLAITNTSAQTVTVLRNTSITGTISFVSSGSYGVGYGCFSVAAGDLDGDGKPEMAVLTNSNLVIVFRNVSTVGVTSFTATNYPTGNTPFDVAISDLDGDSKPDLALTNTLSSTVSVLRNKSTNGTIAFDPKVDYATGTNPYGLVICDLDRDGQPDIAAQNTGTGLSVLRNQEDGPNIIAFTPANGAIGTTITITGVNFIGASAVSFGGMAATSFTVVSNTEITAVVATIGGGPVSVTTPRGTGSLGGFYNGPAISSFSPDKGPVGTTVTIAGSNFSPVPAGNLVYFGAVKAVVTAATTSSLTITVPAGTTYQPITVTTNNLTGYSNKPYTVTFMANTVGFTAASFAAKADYASGAGATGVSAGDLDGDNRPDLAVANYTANTISIIKNSSTGAGISLNPKVDYATDNGPYNIAIGDLDGDGKADLAVAYFGSNTVSVFRNTSSGGVISFAARIDYDAGQSSGIVIHDLDRDGRPEMVLVNYGANTVSIFNNKSTVGVISFANKIDITVGDYPYNVSVGDLDGDGRPDLVAVNSNAYSVSLLRNTSVSGAISFAAKVNYNTGLKPSSVALGDLNDDGKADLAIVYNNNSNIVSVFRNVSTAGTIALAPRIDYTTGTLALNVAITDLNGDGKPDLAAVNNGSGTVSLFKNLSSDGIISFAPKVDYTTGTTPQSIMPVDMDGDGLPDLVTANGPANTVSILRNQLSSATPATTICPNGSTSITSAISGAAYQWQVNTGTGFTNINDNTNYSGTTSGTLQLSNLPSNWSGYQYRCLVAGNYSAIVELRFTTMWTGNAGNAWENGANWSCGAIPDIYTDIIINNGAVVLNSIGFCRTLTVMPGVSFTISTGKSLTVAR